MDKEYTFITNPSKYKPHYNTIIRATYSGVTHMIYLDNSTAEHIKLGFLYNGIRYYDNEFKIAKGESVKFFADVEDGYNIDKVYINGEKYTSAVLNVDYPIEFDTIVHATEVARKYYANFTAVPNTTLTVRYIDEEGQEIIDTIEGDTVKRYMVPYGTEFDVGYTIATGYHGELRENDIPTEKTHFVVKGENLWIATFAEKNVYTVNMVYPDNACLQISYTDDDGVYHEYETGDLADPTKLVTSFNAVYDSLLTIRVIVNIGTVVQHIYINKTIDIPNHTQWSLTDNISVSTIVADIIKTITINNSDVANNVVIYRDGRYTYKNGEVPIKYGDYIYFDMTPKDSFLHYIKAIKINDFEFPGLESYQVLDNLTIDSVVGINVYKKFTLTIGSVINGNIKVEYINKVYSVLDSPIEVLEDYYIKCWLEPNPGYKVEKLVINGKQVPIDHHVAYKITDNISITGSVVEDI